MSILTGTAFTTALANHLWQSTVLVVAAWLLTRALRNNHASTRYNIWLIASLKFLVPFSVLIEIGKSIASKFAAPVAAPALSSAMQQITQPFPQAPYFFDTASAGSVHHAAILPIVLAALWFVGALVLAVTWFRQWLQLRAAVRSASPAHFQIGIPVRLSSSLLEPGVFGIVNPVLMLPVGITEKLTQDQLSAIFAHELCHVRRRDNLTFALHTLVQTLFWFHPLVWWVKKHLIEERENACDEAVLQTGSDSEVYAESILNVCKFYIESPLACVSGVTGADLKKRIVRIMTEHATLQLNFGKKLLLAAAALVAISVPVTFGLLHTSQLHAQTQAAQSTPNPAPASQPDQPMPPNANPQFEVATIKPSAPNETLNGFTSNGRHISMAGEPIANLIMLAYGVNHQQIIGAPAWLTTEKYDIDGVTNNTSGAPDTSGDPSLHQMQAMYQKLLADRFKLSIHHEQQVLPAYAITVLKSGPKLAKSQGDPNGPPDQQGYVNAMKFTNTSMSDLALILELSTGMFDRPIVDQTALPGRFDFALKWTPGGSSTTDPNAPPGIFTAIQEQLGLKLSPVKAPVDTLVIDHVERPSSN